MKVRLQRQAALRRANEQLRRELVAHQRLVETLRETEARYRLLFEQSPDGIVIIDPETTRLLEFNEMAHRQLGYSRADFARLSISDIEAAETPEETRTRIADVSREGRRDFETRQRTRQGEIRNIHVTAQLTEIMGRRVYHGVWRDITEVKQAEKKLEFFAREILATREEDRKQVSFVLHHDVGSLAVGISAHLNAIEEDLRAGKPEKALQLIKQARKLFDESVVRMKKLAHELRPPDLDILGLRAALRQHFAQVTEHRGTRIHFQETLGRRRVPGDIATILFRIAQEALTNAFTHGHATRVDVGLGASKKEIILTVRNNGKKFDPSEHDARATAPMGLRVMREMAELAGGTFTIDSGRGRGTAVRVSLPFKAAVLGSEDGAVREGTVARGKTIRSAGRSSRSQKGSGA